MPKETIPESQKPNFHLQLPNQKTQGAWVAAKASGYRSLVLRGCSSAGGVASSKGLRISNMYTGSGNAVTVSPEP